jgi:2Fe-2S ferredoxin
LTEEVQPQEMPRITFIEHDGTERTVAADAGRSVMQAATDHLVPGILADCGGNCACATCHVYVDASWQSKLTPPSKEEREIIECALHVQDSSRLSCQIPVTAELDGLVIRMPESQT